MRKTFFLFLLFPLLLSQTYSQQIDQIKWTFSVTVLNENEAEIILKARTQDKWHLYSSKTSDGGPLPLVVTLDKSNDFTKVGGLVESPKPKEEMDEIFGVIIRYFAGHDATIKQKIRLNSKSPFSLSGKIEGQVCDDSNCISFDQTFAINVDPANIITGTADDTDGDKVPNDKDQCPDEPGLPEFNGCPDSDNDKVPDHIDRCPGLAGTIEFGGCPDSDGDGIPDDLDKCPQRPADTPDGCPEISQAITTADFVIPQRYSAKQGGISFDDGCGETGSTKSSRSLWGIFIAGFLGGLIALMMPCLFPMIPLTVSFFTKQSKTRAKGIANAMIYAASIMIIYTGLGLLITIIAGPGALNDMATSAFWNLLFFTIFIIFAASFLGAFEITLPSRFVNAVDKSSNRGGLIGIFFMAFTLCLVSFSCTGPIIGSLLVEAASSGSYQGPAVGMFGFSVALALPFALFAAFPGWLNTLPKSGSWMNTVKVSLGFLELALALKFLSVVDLAYHWGFLKREMFLSLWVVIFVSLGLYLFGIIKLSQEDERTGKTSVIRIFFAVIFLGFAMYLLPGIFGAPVRLMSGLAPPLFYREWNPPENHCPHGIDCYHDYNEGMAVAKQQQKPVMLDFTGWGCVNCRDMEENVWIDPKILRKLKEEYILISLYVDDKGVLPKDQRTPSFRTGSPVTTVGEKWKDFQIYFYDEISQPQYVLLDNYGQLLANPISSTDIDTYNRFLEEGLCRYQMRKNNN